MACGCGGACCQDNSMQRGLGFLWWGGESGGGSDLYGDYDYLYDYGGGSDLYGDYDYFFDYGGGYGGYVPGGPSFNVDFGFTPTNRQPGSYGSGDSAWQQLLDWWAELTAPRVPLPGPEPNASTLPPYSGYCPPNTYCADFPTCSRCVPLNETPAQKARRLAEQAAKAAAAKAQQQKQQQRCPDRSVFNPITKRCERACPQGMQPDAQAVCRCPQGTVYSATYQRCVLPSQLTAADKKDLQAPDWLKWALLAGIAVLVVKRK